MGRADEGDNRWEWLRPYRLGLAGIRNSVILFALLLHTSVPIQPGEGCKNSAITKKRMDKI